MAHPVDEKPELIAYLKPSHARPDRWPVMVKRPSFPRGKVPPHLEEYVQAVKAVKERKQG